MAREKTQNAQIIISWIYVIVSMKFLEVHSHGRLIEPPSRASMWRYKLFYEIMYRNKIVEK